MKHAWKLYYILVGLGVLVMFNAMEIGMALSIDARYVATVARLFTISALIMLPFIQAGGVPSAPESLADVFTLRNSFVAGGVLYFGGAIFKDFGLDPGPWFMGIAFLLFLGSVIVSFVRNMIERFS